MKLALLAAPSAAPPHVPAQPANVVTTPPEIARILLFPTSATYTTPVDEAASPRGFEKLAELAGPSDAPTLHTPVQPANVVTTPAEMARSLLFA